MVHAVPVGGCVPQSPEDLVVGAGGNHGSGGGGGYSGGGAIIILEMVVVVLSMLEIKTNTAAFQSGDGLIILFNWYSWMYLQRH